LGIDRAHVGVGIALAAIVVADRLAVGVDKIRIVDVAAEQKAQHVGGGSLDHGRQLPFAENGVADEVDLLDRRLRTFRYLEDEIDTVAAAVDDHGLDAGVVASETTIGLNDVVDVGL